MVDHVILLYSMCWGGQFIFDETLSLLRNRLVQQWASFRWIYKVHRCCSNTLSRITVDKDNFPSVLNTSWFKLDVAFPLVNIVSGIFCFLIFLFYKLVWKLHMGIDFNGMRGASRLVLSVICLVQKTWKHTLLQVLPLEPSPKRWRGWNKNWDVSTTTKNTLENCK